MNLRKNYILISLLFALMMSSILANVFTDKTVFAIILVCFLVVFFGFVLLSCLKFMKVDSYKSRLYYNVSLSTMELIFFATFLGVRDYALIVNKASLFFVNQTIWDYLLYNVTIGLIIIILIITIINNFQVYKLVTTNTTPKFKKLFMLDNKILNALFFIIFGALLFIEGLVGTINKGTFFETVIGFVALGYGVYLLYNRIIYLKNKKGPKKPRKVDSSQGFVS